MVAIFAAALLLVPAQASGKGKAKKKPAPTKEIEEIDPTGRFEGGIINQASSFFVWFEDGEWRLRTGSTKKKTTFSGVIKVKNGAFASWHGAGLEKGKKNPDVFRVNGDRTEISFSFITLGKADGLNFKVKGDDAILEFSLNGNGRTGPRVVKIGKEKQYPSGMPFRIRAKPPELNGDEKKPGKKETSDS